MTSTLTLHASGPVVPAEAWDRYLRMERWSQWAPQIRGVESGAALIAAGVTGRVRAPLGLAVPFRVTDVDVDARRWSWTVRVGPVSLALLHWVSAGPDGGSTTGLRMRGPLPLLAGYAPLAQVALSRLVRIRTVGDPAAG